MAGAWLAGAAAFADDPVYTANIYGVKKVEAASNSLTMAAMPFEANPSGIQQVIGDQMTAGSSYATGDRIMLWDAAAQKYKKFYLRSHANPTYNRKWIDTSQTPNLLATNVIVPGAGFWIHNIQGSNQNVRLAGSVVTNDSLQITLAPGLQMIAYPYSSEVDVNDMGLTNGLAGAGPDEADELIIWDAPGQKYIYCYLRAHADPLYNRKWIDISQEPNVVATNVLKPGDAFWYHRQDGSSFDWQVERPYPKP